MEAAHSTHGMISFRLFRKRFSTDLHFPKAEFVVSQFRLFHFRSPIGLIMLHFRWMGWIQSAVPYKNQQNR
jgi:hypothetical protein